MYTNDEIPAIVAKQLNGQATLQELEQLQLWIAADTANQQEYEELVKIWEHSEHVLGPALFDTGAAWQKMDAAIRNGQHNNATAPAKVVRFSFVKRIAVAASVLVVIASGWYLWTINHASWQTVTAKDQNISLQLPDGSAVLLRKGSVVKYPAAFAKKERQVELTGEAFFQVRHNAQQPFVVITPVTEIKVLGTSFLVRATAASNEVAVTTGTVSVTEKDAADNQVTLVAGQKAVLQNNQFTQTILTDSNYIAWKTGTLDFKQTPLVKVLEDISNYYGVTVGFAPGSEAVAGNRLVTVRFDNQPLEEVLEELRLITGLQTKKENDKVLFSQK